MGSINDSSLERFNGVTRVTVVVSRGRAIRNNRTAAYEHVIAGLRVVSVGIAVTILHRYVFRVLNEVAITQACEAVTH